MRYKGKTYSFDELVELRRGEGLAEQITLEARTAKHMANQLPSTSLRGFGPRSGRIVA